MQEECKSLTREQKQAIGLLSIGTFLEYFDLMLYVHMAVFLNQLFFEPTDVLTASLYTALAFCSTFVFRPIGALIFGYIGDNIGRKSTITITTFLMAGCCFTMLVIPTYAEIGVTASILITICRIVQGMSSMGEIIGAELYVTEITKPPAQYPAVTIVAAFATCGSIFALLVATLVTSFGYNWRYAFGFGMIIALVGGAARTKLRETPEFANAKLRIKNKIEALGFDPNEIDSNPIVTKKVNKKSIVSLFLMDSGWPVAFYITYFYCSIILKDVFHYSPAQIIQHNLMIASVNFLERLFLSYLSYKIYPLKIMKYRLIVFTIFMLFTPYLLSNVNSPNQLLLMQMVMITFGCTTLPGVPIIYKYFPVFKRFTCVTLSYALSSALIYAITSFGLIYLTAFLGHYGILAIVIPVVIGFAFAINHFENLEREAGDYPVTTNPSSVMES
jgi:MFS transporter, MHS family, proline/betaine transporter